MQTVDSDTAIGLSAARQKQIREDAVEVFEWFREWYDAEDESLVLRRDALPVIASDLGWESDDEEPDIERVNRALSQLLTDKPDPVIQIIRPDGKFVGIADFGVWEDAGAYGFHYLADGADAAKPAVVCGRCVEVCDDHQSVTMAIAGEGRHNADAGYGTLRDAITSHIVSAHECPPEDVTPAANLTSPTNIGGNEAFHKGNDGPGSGLNADTVDGTEAADLGGTVSSKVRKYNEALTFQESNVTVSGTSAIDSGSIALPTSSWDLGATFDTTTFSSSFSEVQEIEFADGGKKAYIVDGGSEISQYTLSDPYDLGTRSLDGTKTAEDGNTFGVAVEDNGTVLVEGGTSSNEVHELSLGTAYDITQNTTVVNTRNTADGSPTGLEWGDGGSKFYELGTSNGIYEYDVGTAYDTSTLSLVDSRVISESSPFGIEFKPDGSQMYVVGTSDNTLREYELTTPWDISTNSQLNSVGSGGNSKALSWADTGEAYYLGDAEITQNVVNSDSNSNAQIEWSSGPVSISSWAVINFGRTLDGETVDVFAAKSTDGGATWSRINSGNTIQSGFSLESANISASDDVRVEVELSAQDPANNNPSFDSAHRSWFVE